MSDDARIHDDASSVSAGDPADSQRREAMKLVGTAALMAAPAGSALLASQPAAASPPSLHGSQEAWQEFQAEANRFRDWMLSQPFANSPLIRAQADFLAMQLPSFTFMYYGGSHTDYPLIRTDSFFVPLLYTTGFPNPDFIYRHVFLDGARRYRMWGQLGSARTMNNVQVFTAFFGSKDPMIGLQNFSVFDYAKEDGSFEFLLGPDVSEGEGIRLKPECHEMFLAFREVTLDWGNETRMDIKIELLDEATNPIIFGEAEMTERLNSATRFIARRQKTLEDTWDLAIGDGVWHQVKALPHTAENTNKHGANAIAHYNYLPYDLAEDEALIMEFKLPNCTYWGTQMMDMWMQSLDFSFRQSSLNKAQTVVDDDGICRMVIAHRDPGVPNWIDTVAKAPGILVYRVYDAKEEFKLPTVKRVAVADLRSNLPATTPVVTPEQRKAQLAKRARDSLGRYGYF